MTTKIHPAADHRCRPLAVLTTEGQRHDSVAFAEVMARIEIPRPGPGPSRTRPDWVLADKAYPARAIRKRLSQRKIKAAIPVKEDHSAARRRKGSAGGRPHSFDSERYRARNTVERAVHKLRATRAVATRYDKRDYVYRGTIDVAAIRIWLRDPTETELSDTP